MGLSIDGARFYLAAHQLQNAADAAALAGAQIVRVDADRARQQSRLFASYNTVFNDGVVLNFNEENEDETDGDIILGHYSLDNSEFIPDLNDRNAVKVIAKRTSSEHGPISLIFGPIVGVHNVDVRRYAIAMSLGQLGSGLLVLNEDNQSPALFMDSNASINIEGGGVHVNSDALAATLYSNVIIEAESFSTSGGDIEFQSNAGYSGGALLEDTGYTAGDPFAGLPPPDFGPDLGGIHLTSNEELSVGPGYYSGGFNLDSNTKLFLAPGVYILDGAGLRINSDSLVQGDGVMLYITNQVNSASSIYMDSNADLIMTPPTEGTYEGIAIFQDRNNTNTVELNSNAETLNIDTSDAVVYLPSAHLYMDSNATLSASQIIVDTALLNSNAGINVNVAPDDSFRKSFLVE